MAVVTFTLALGLLARPLSVAVGVGAPTGRGASGSVVANGLTRRAALVLAPSVLAAGSIAMPALAASDGEKALVAELRDCAERLKPLAAMIDKEQWDPVRSVLKNPPVANLWNLGTRQSPSYPTSAATILMYGDSGWLTDCLRIELVCALRRAATICNTHCPIYHPTG
jgi:hypothetical protein